VSLRVVAAVIRRDGKTLISHRRDKPGRPGQWEFPGGKVEPGESDADALRRECLEEMDVRVLVGPRLLEHRHDYPELSVDLVFYACTLSAEAEPKPLGMASLEWAPFGTLGRYDFLEADRAVLARLDPPPR
jgi:8-oxo-dGTP diphosphatase